MLLTNEYGDFRSSDNGLAVFVCGTIKAGKVDCKVAREKDISERQKVCNYVQTTAEIDKLVASCKKAGVVITKNDIKKINNAGRACNDFGAIPPTMSGGAIAGIVIGSVVIIAIVVYVIMKRRRSKAGF